MAGMGHEYPFARRSRNGSIAPSADLRPGIRHAAVVLAAARDNARRPRTRSMVEDPTLGPYRAGQPRTPELQPAAVAGADRLPVAVAEAEAEGQRARSGSPPRCLC